MTTIEIWLVDNYGTLRKCFLWTTSPHHNRFTALFPGPPGWAGARRELLDCMVQGKINRGRHTDHPLGATPSGLSSAQLHHLPILYTGQMPFLPPNQQYQSAEGKVFSAKHFKYVIM